MRSRYVQPGKEPAGESEVYLDENFLECMCNFIIMQVKWIHLLFLDIMVSPVYLRSHSGAVLLKAIQADTEFLSRNNVMDYSMLTGIDENNNDLVLGIIGLCYFHIIKICDQMITVLYEYSIIL